MKKQKQLWALMFSASLVLAACGGGEDVGEEVPEQAPSDQLENPEEMPSPEEGTQDPGETPATEENDGAATEENTNATTAAAGQKVYERSCISCHGENLEGGFGPALAAIGADMSQEEIRKVIDEGQGQMPPDIVEGEEADAVAAWLADQK